MSHSDAFDRVLLQVRQRNIAVFNAFRPVAVALFLIAQLCVDKLSVGTWVLILYTFVAVVLFLVARRSENVAKLSAMAIPFFDMPCIFLKQWLDMVPGVSTDFRALANFTIGLFILLIMLSTFTLRSKRLFISGGMAIFFQVLLQAKAGDVPVGIVGGCIALVLAVVLCEIALNQRIQMLHLIAEESLRRERMQRYFSPEVAAAIQLTNPSLETGQEFDVTVLFSDLRGFTTVAQAASPVEVVELLNLVHSGLVEQVFAHGGTLDKYIGDGLMAYFGAPVARGDHALQAFSCARGMLEKIERINLIRAQSRQPPLRLSIGLHSGKAVVGAIGAVTRREFTVVGDTVNVAARVERLNRQFDTEMLVSGETHRRLAAPPLRFVAETLVRGREDPVRIFALEQKQAPPDAAAAPAQVQGQQASSPSAGRVATG